MSYSLRLLEFEFICKCMYGKHTAMIEYNCVHFHALCAVYMRRMMCASNEITFDWFIRQIQELGGGILLNIYYKY